MGDICIRNDFSSFFCTECNENLSHIIPSFDSMKCGNCHNFKSLLRCRKTICKFQRILCRVCDAEKFAQLRSSVHCSEKSSIFNSMNDNGTSDFNKIYIFFISLVVLAAFIIYHFSTNSVTSKDENFNNIKLLRKHYHLQNNETWYHFMGVLEKEIPTVKTITLLHGEDRRTSDCLTNELIFLYTKNKNIKNEEITFSHFGYEVKDYGIVLEHYRPRIKKYGIFITDLNKVTGNIARIFHTLCDEISSDNKPSLFIFTLRYDKELKNLKPIERATTILREAWSDLPESEIFPLLSRIIKNVVEIIPEEQILC